MLVKYMFQYESVLFKILVSVLCFWTWHAFELVFGSVSLDYRIIGTKTLNEH